VAAENLEVPVSCILADLTISAAEIAALVPGSVIPLPADALLKAELRAGNQRIARGEVVRIGDRLALLVAEAAGRAPERDGR
jgi:flagellar motor switch/type III secretory pathway protein FliN